MKSKYVPTEEQKLAAKERREKIKEACKRLAALPIEKRVILANHLGVRNAQGRELSVYNTCLLAMQLPTVSVVGGFKQWREVGRCVRKGARALAIWIPLGTKGESTGSADAAGADESDECRFMLCNVFDISQTRAVDEAEPAEAPTAPQQYLALPEVSSLRAPLLLTAAA